MTAPVRYRKRPVEVVAVQLRWTTWSEVCALLGDALAAENPDGAYYIARDEVSDPCGEPGPDYIGLKVRTVHGDAAPVRHGDWIIPDGAPGTFYPVKPDVFAATYEPADRARPPEDVLDALCHGIAALWPVAAEYGPEAAMTALRALCACEDVGPEMRRRWTPEERLLWAIYGDRDALNDEPEEDGEEELRDAVNDALNGTTKSNDGGRNG